MFDNTHNVQKKYKILMISDHALSTSGVGTQSRYLITGLVNTGKYSFRQLGAALRHESHDIITVNPDFVIKPIDGFGDVNMIRQVIATERPDCLLLFTDPRFFQHITYMEDEIHQVCPIAWNTIWDERPTPMFNDVVYQSTDLLNCISKLTYDMISEICPDRTNHIPHAVPQELFFPVKKELVEAHRVKLFGKERAEKHLIFLWIARNARRKCPGDALSSFKLFLDKLQEKHGHRNATLVMHTDPKDVEGPNLYAIVDMLKLNNDVIFSTNRTDFQEMNMLYNACDSLIANSCAEGFGLPLLEMKQCGRPIIAVKTGGMTPQVTDSETGFEYGVALEPDVKTLVGNQAIPYITEYLVSHETLSNAMLKMYEMGPDKRREIGELARKHCLKEFNINNMIRRWDETLTNLIEGWRAGNREPRWQKVDL